MTDAELEAETRMLAIPVHADQIGRDGFANDRERALLRLLDEARADLERAQAAVAGQIKIQNALRAEIARLTAPPGASRWLHKKRGTTYQAVGVATIQAPTDFPLGDEAIVVVYRAESDGALWVRRFTEFHDGRFEELPAIAAPPGASAMERADTALRNAVAMFPGAVWQDAVSEIARAIEQAERDATEKERSRLLAALRDVCPDLRLAVGCELERVQERGWSWSEQVIASLRAAADWLEKQP